MNTPFYDEMVAAASRGPRFYVPGHKGNPLAAPALAGLLALDLTEVDGCYDLSHPEPGALEDSQRNMAAVFGAGATLYSAGGSTSCVQAMLALYAGRQADGREPVKVAMGRGGHISGPRALGLLGAQPVWVPRRGGYVFPRDVDATLARSGAKIVHVTSPDYHGRLPDLAGIAAVCRKHGAALLVDNAQGAHLRFFSATAARDGLPAAAESAAGSLHPLALGADAVNDSAHKTLPCLTSAALLHLRDPALAGEARRAFNLFASTSPSYLVLESLDLAAGQLLDAPPDFSAAARRLQKAGQAFAAIVAPCDDPLRLVLRPSLAGVDAGAFHRAMLAEGIAPEYDDGDAYVLMASPWNTEADFEWLARALEKAARQLPQSGPPAGNPPAAFPTREEAAALAPEPLPEVAAPLRQSLFGPKERLPVEAAAGRVCAGLDAPCPPGTPLVVPGERITPDVCHNLAAGGISHIDVVK